MRDIELLKSAILDKDGAQHKICPNSKFPCGKGDANNDGKVTVLDLVLIQSFIKKADVNGDGRVTQKDIEIMKERILGKDPKCKF